MLTAIACAAQNGVIGRQGRLPWSLPEDMAHFKALTMGHALIMGRRTFESVGAPLPGRQIIVLSRQEGLSLPEGVMIAPSPETALKMAARLDKEPFVAGGEEIFRLLEPEIARIELTRLDAPYEGDRRFPIDTEDGGWRKAAETPFSQGVFQTFLRRPA